VVTGIQSHPETNRSSESKSTTVLRMINLPQPLKNSINRLLKE
jgi:hypothetical protein